MTYLEEQRLSPASLPLVHVHLAALRANWRFLQRLAGKEDTSRPWPALMPVVKADAYGHGMVQVAEVLLREGARALAVGSVAEAACLRRALAGASPAAPGGVRIVPLLGLQTSEEAQAVFTHGLTPLVHSPAQLELLAAAHGESPSLPIAVKIDTGMSRLGFSADDPAALEALLRSFPGLKPSLLLTHIAAADDPEQLPGARRQVERFKAAFDLLRATWPDLAPSLANSAATLADKELLSAFSFHVRRPGFALYGGNPFAGTSLAHLGKALQPVMSVTAPVLAVHDLPQGGTVSYGCTFTAPKPMRVATIGAGYADGFSRGLSGKGFVCLRGKRCPILGRVCMQMHIVDVGGLPGRADPAAGESAHLLGGEGSGAVSPDDLAAAWGTIPYEALCLLGKNSRIFHDD